MIKHESFAVYSSTESGGKDIVIKDNIDRYVLVSEEDLNDLIESLVKQALNMRGEASAKTPFVAL